MPENKNLITASIMKSTPIQTRPVIQKASKPLTFAAGVKPPRKRASAMNWPPEFEALKAPSYHFANADGAAVTPILAETGETVSFRVDESGEAQFNRRLLQDDGTYKTEQVDQDDVLFQSEDGSQWTPEHVKPLVDYDHCTMEGTPEVLNKMYNAASRFSKATGKGLIVRQESQNEDERGNILTQKKLFIRIR